MPGTLHHLFTTKIEEEPTWSGMEGQFNCGMKGSVLPKLPVCERAYRFSSFIAYFQITLKIIDL